MSNLSISHPELRIFTYFFIQCFLHHTYHHILKTAGHFGHIFLICSVFCFVFCSGSCKKLVDGIFMYLINLFRCRQYVAVAGKRSPLRHGLYDFATRIWLMEPPAMIFASEKRYAVPFYLLMKILINLCGIDRTVLNSHQFLENFDSEFVLRYLTLSRHSFTTICDYLSLLEHPLLMVVA